jgi:hypothetical protein
MTVAAARELVGQPFLRDHRVDDLLEEKRVGPVHVKACHRSITKSQAARQMRFPDATIATTSFGVYIADNVQKSSSFLSLITGTKQLHAQRYPARI